MSRPSHVCLLGLLWLWFPVGCSNSEPVVSEPPLARPMPERPLATTVKFVAYLNSLAEKGWVSLEEIAANTFAENDEQRGLVALFTVASQVDSVEEACLEAFGFPLNPTPGYAPLRGQWRDIALVEEADRRATARVVDGTWRLSRLMLVEYDGRWWISGHSWDDATQPEFITALGDDEHVDAGVRLSVSFAARVRAGEFGSVEAARAGFRQALQDFHAANRGN